MNSEDRLIDIHTHILPGVDDGSGSMEETIRMLRIAAEQNVRTIIATPHYAANADNVPVDELYRIRDMVQQEAMKIHEDYKILLGNELYYSESIVDSLKSKKALTLADSRYILVEFEVDENYKTIYHGLGSLIRSGYIPILAHVERYISLSRREDLVEELVKSGCYIQMNSSQLIGGLLDTQAHRNRRWLRRGLIHFVGSDCHSDRSRSPIMKDVVNILRRKHEERIIHQIFVDNPTKILENTYI